MVGPSISGSWNSHWSYGFSVEPIYIFDILSVSISIWVILRRCSPAQQWFPAKGTENTQLSWPEMRMEFTMVPYIPKKHFQEIHFLSIWSLWKHPKSFPIPIPPKIWSPIPSIPSIPIHGHAWSAGASAAVPNAAPASPRARHSPGAAPTSGTAQPEAPLRQRWGH